MSINYNRHRMNHNHNSSFRMIIIFCEDHHAMVNIWSFKCLCWVGFCAQFCFFATLQVDLFGSRDLDSLVGFLSFSILNNNINIAMNSATQNLNSQSGPWLCGGVIVFVVVVINIVVFIIVVFIVAVFKLIAVVVFLVFVFVVVLYCSFFQDFKEAVCEPVSYKG